MPVPTLDFLLWQEIRSVLWNLSVMYASQQKEQFSLAYIHAVATVAGFSLADVRVDDDSVDCTLCSRSKSGRIHSPRLDIQAKCTARHQPGQVHIAFPLDGKNYDDLRDPDVLVPRILVIVCVPEALGDWIDHTEDRLELRRCGYWLSLHGMSATNTETTTVHVPRVQPFSVAQVQAIMNRIAGGGLP